MKPFELGDGVDNLLLLLKVVWILNKYIQKKQQQNLQQFESAYLNLYESLGLSRASKILFYFKYFFSTN